MIEVSPLRQDDRAAWEVLARAYKDFYETEVPDTGYDEVWRRLMEGPELFGLAARLDGEVVGIVHYLFHANVWSPGACYLQDLYVDEKARGHGAARALIERVARETGERGLSRLYWNTKQDNALARTLYDKVARFRGFITYEYSFH
ncbi:GNAT family N-acetyltransferase [Umezawaea tangerina]|uniref:Acetyltransferase (GNAT) family protein n=1 Tax=Umezawaea tangerina TaxID=84725 RepID=A0A2T0T7G4_9PSEU|nr:GNAT family N-acetyltransferase [Umezawaea tangerina]PRY41583.1 acetyltransferase (GNAT) family protein [Umezawaea tangerina]